MTDSAPGTTLEKRRDDAFPVLTAAEIERLRRYGVVRRYGAGEVLFEIGKPGPGMFVLLEGRVRVVTREAHGDEIPIVEHGPGHFMAEVGQLAGKPAFVEGKAVTEVETLLVAPDQLRAVLVGEAELGEKIMRALIVRRVALIERGAGGAVIIGGEESPDVVRLTGFLRRNGYPYEVLDPAVDEDARDCTAHAPADAGKLPWVACPNGQLLSNPSEEALGRCLGMTEAGGTEGTYDVIVAGAGPAGLSTAVYAGSEGLSVLVIDARAFGGQAGASMRIENYFGFPTGITGMALAGRGFNQAQKFGAQMLIPMRIVRLDCEREAPGAPIGVRLSDGRRVEGRCVVIATGAAYRRPRIRNLEAYEGRGVSYWASPIEAKLCKGEEVALVGGGNSAGQAAVFLAAHARKVWMLVRAEGLADTMSKYLIDRIEATPNIELVTRTDVVEVRGDDDGVAAITWRHRDTGGEERRELRHLFLFVGAEPATAWLRGCPVALDDKGFVKAGSDLHTNVEGVFAVGDVRSGSVKRVGAAIGEGANVVPQIHAYLAHIATAAAPPAPPSGRAAR